MDEQFIFCLASNCKNKLKSTKWGRIKAEDWFFGKGGTAYCPEHIPEWVEEWKGKKKDV